MAQYTYKDVCYSIPEHIEAAFTKEHGREPDGDPGYDGDYWTLASMWIDEKDAEIDRLRSELAALQATGIVPDKDCRCGSGAHPRHCEKHPHRYDMHVREINESMELDELRTELAALRRDAALGAKVRRSISGMDPESKIDRLEIIARDHGPDTWEHDILRAIAKALREEA